MSKEIRYNPFELKHSINDLFDNFFSFPKSYQEEKYIENIHLDITEDEFAYSITADLAGIEEKDIDIELDKNKLTIKAKREHLHKDKKHHVQECYYGEFQRSINLPDNIDSDKIEAKYNNGVLTLNIPKKEKDNSTKKISIKS
ncbi:MULTISPECIES: Hsp20/alpha crystallin family protein [Francisella]|uniref:Hsp20/alpha crystallin family protein n=1 Tax=Francisella opportunistica TaxID=2016517 RepID=A0A345JTI3_9GAMM|nr:MULTISPECIES: Hsp20/alpha crystallin family protein [Francisella]APC92427.1 Small heat shock protein [Francisella sp. MA067296]AXH30629.1 Hsp20/alpha crystallin family protein [Francisella opportunistica]AXH32269.1 molecular chaperone Hsp20 [Francisella opportunistica]AXH33918.1 molecular chaperone Hsp20 [Francisella opportunistica]